MATHWLRYLSQLMGMEICDSLALTDIHGTVMVPYGYHVGSHGPWSMGYPSGFPST